MPSLSGGPFLQPPRVPLPWLQQTLHAVPCSGSPQAHWGVRLGTGSCPCMPGEDDVLEAVLGCHRGNWAPSWLHCSPTRGHDGGKAGQTPL